MEGATLWLENFLESHVKPGTRVAKCHQGVLDLRMEEMRESLPQINNLFNNVRLEMAGSVLNDTKVGESDEFDVNVVIKLPFEEKHASLEFDKSSPGYALIQVTEAAVATVAEDFDICFEHEDKFYVNAHKLSQLLSMAIGTKFNYLNCGGTSGYDGYKNDMTFRCNMFGDIMALKCDDGWEYVAQPKDFDLDLAPCVQVPMSLLKNHPAVNGALRLGEKPKNQNPVSHTWILMGNCILKLICFLHFFDLSTPSAAKMRFHFLYFLQGKNAQNRSKNQQN